MVIDPEATRAALLYPLTVVFVMVTVRAAATPLARIPNPDPQPLCWVMSNTLTLVPKSGPGQVAGTRAERGRGSVGDAPGHPGNNRYGGYQHN